MRSVFASMQSKGAGGLFALTQPIFQLRSNEHPVSEKKGGAAEALRLL